MDRYAIIRAETGKVVNICLWDGNKHTWQPDEGCSAVKSDALQIGDYVEWFAPTREEINALKSEKILTIKDEAQAKIYARVPVWKQANYNARMNELNMIRFEREWTEKELSEIAVMATAWADVKQIRLDSDAAEKAVNAAATIAEINAVQF